MDDLLPTIGYAALGFVVILALTMAWIARAERRTMVEWRKYVKQRANPPKPAPLPPIEWDDGLDISHLQVKHEPTREQP